MNSKNSIVTLSIPTEELTKLNKVTQKNNWTLLTTEKVIKPKITSWETMCMYIDAEIKPVKGVNTFISQLMDLNPTGAKAFLTGVICSNNECKQKEAWDIIKDKFLSLLNENKETKAKDSGK